MVGGQRAVDQRPDAEGRRPVCRSLHSRKSLKHPRWLHVLPNGDVLVAEAATEPGKSWSPRAIVQNWVQRRSGVDRRERQPHLAAARHRRRRRRGASTSCSSKALRQPFGMALIGDQLYVANTDSVVRFPYQDGQTRITDKGTKLLDLPVGHHWTRALLASRRRQQALRDGRIGQQHRREGHGHREGPRHHPRARYSRAGKSRIFASGLRNANGMAFEPSTGTLWTVVNERDEIGDDVPPDYLTSVKDGGFYGWPYSYWGKTVDNRVQPQRPDLVATALTPDYALGAHTAALGLAYYDGKQLPERFGSGMIIGQHGSWNRSTYSGYKVIFVPFKERPAERFAARRADRLSQG